MEKSGLIEKVNDWARKSVSLKLLSIGFLILILLIPNSMITSLIIERQGVRDGAIKEVSAKWGMPQTIGGPVLSIPYNTILKDDKGQSETVVRYAHFLPDVINITGTIVPEKRYRGIYLVVLYNAKLHITGKFSYPNIVALPIPETNYQVESSSINIGIPDMIGLNENINFKLNDTSYAFNPGLTCNDIFNSGASFKFDLIDSDAYHFSYDLNINGSSSLNFLPFGKETNVSIQSNWDSPSFEGSFLPDRRKLNKDGFEANWKVLHLNRNYPQQGLGAYITKRDKAYPDYESSDLLSSFGVKLILPIDEYQKTIRSVKYCVMFIIITFLTFFFVEVLNKKRIHPVQYLLVGFAICLFYILLLSISEHLKFNYAYLIGSICTLTMITLYASTIFNNNKITLLFGSLLAILYGFFYSLLQLEDYALLLGTLGLFIILAVIMYFTRKINWYSIDDHIIEESQNNS